MGAIHEEASPNGDSVIWFLEEIFPRIQSELGRNIPFTLAGVNKSERVRQLASSSVNIAGRLPDLTRLYDAARVFVAPTRYAAGIPHKVHEAAARGVPIVATPLLAIAAGLARRRPDPCRRRCGYVCAKMHRVASESAAVDAASRRRARAHPQRVLNGGVRIRRHELFDGATTGGKSRTLIRRSSGY